MLKVLFSLLGLLDSPRIDLAGREQRSSLRVFEKIQKPASVNPMFQLKCEHYALEKMTCKILLWTDSSRQERGRVITWLYDFVLAFLI